MLLNMPPVKQRIDEPEYATPLAERIIQSEQSRLLRSGRGGFDYEGISQRYPLADIRRATAPSYVRRELDEEDVMLNLREAELAKRQADLQIQDSLVNQTREMYRQIPEARAAISQLDPASDDFLNQLITLQSENPLAYENPDFQKTVVDPLVRRNEMFQSNKLRQKQPETVGLSPKDYEDMIVRRDMLLGKKDLAELQANEPDKAFAIEQLNRMIFDYQQQNAPRGGFGGAAPATPSPTMPSVQLTPQPTQGSGLNALRSFIGE
jgi:hypothetical protein